MKRERIVAGITNGDINGIGYEIIIKGLMDNRINDICTPVVYGSPKVAAYHRKALNIGNFSFNNIRSPGEANHKRANLINCLSDDIRVELGKSTRDGGEGAYRSLEAAVNDLKDGNIDLIVTAPIDKQSIQSDTFTFPGHTEYLQQSFGVDEVLMLMISENMKIGTVTGHIPLSEVPGALSKELVINKIRVMGAALVNDFIVRRPRIAVLGLNPHAGDNDLLGTEERDVITPAVEQARSEGILAFGPYAADGFFGSGQFLKFDGILAMYHDQGLAPFKALAFDSGVNYTAGLPVVRTSPAHGTAFGIAGAGQASPEAFRQALYVACEIFRNREINAGITENPLEGQQADKMCGDSDELPLAE